MVAIDRGFRNGRRPMTVTAHAGHALTLTPLGASSCLPPLAITQTGKLEHVPETMIDEVLPIVIDDDYVLCNGGDDTLVGHPIEMIKVDSPWPAVCKYCGLRYINREMAAKNADWAFLVGVRSCMPLSLGPACRPPPSLILRCCAHLSLSQADPKGLPTYDGVAADSTRQPYSG